MKRRVALLRAVNVGGRRLPMAELRALCRDLGWGQVETYLQSGNLLFCAAGEATRQEKELEEAIARKFGFDVPVLVRSADQWSRIAAGNPFPEAARNSPNLLLVYLSRAKPVDGAEAAIAARAADGERVERVGDALWIHFPGGSGRSRLTPSLIDRAIGSASTSRNFRTVVALQERLGE